VQTSGLAWLERATGMFREEMLVRLRGNLCGRDAVDLNLEWPEFLGKASSQS